MMSVDFVAADSMRQCYVFTSSAALVTASKSLLIFGLCLDIWLIIFSHYLLSKQSLQN